MTVKALSHQSLNNIPISEGDVAVVILADAKQHFM
jgi:hypothetical protein